MITGTTASASLEPLCIFIPRSADPTNAAGAASTPKMNCGDVENNANKYGYITGLSFANQLGLTTQMPAVIEIVTNREATNGRTLMVGNQKVRVKKSAIPVSEDNAELLQLLDSVGQAEKYTELTIEETVDVLITYMRKKKFTKKQLSDVSSVLTGATAKKLIEWGIIYEFAS